MSADAPLVAYKKEKIGSESGFGIVFAAVFAIVGLWPLTRSEPPRWWALALALAFIAAAFLFPRVLAPLNRLWFGLGLLLHKIVNPVLMALIYYGAVMPTGLILRAMGKDLLRLKPAPEQDSYWIKREPPGPPRGSMSKQF